MFTHAVLGVIAVFTLVSCQTNQAEIAKKQQLFAKEPVKVELGKASYYYGRWIGRLTANGETYRREDVTAAHKSLPFGTYVRVHNLANDRNMVVRINNRGPFIRGRVIDLSLRAAEHLKMRNAGVVPVRVEVLDPVADKEAIASYVRKRQFDDES
jgi:rare lipoprotein A